MWKIKIVLRDGLKIEAEQIIAEEDLQKQFESVIIKVKVREKIMLINTENILYIEYYEIKPKNNIRKFNE